jgi:hypothetical protein
MRIKKLSFRLMELGGEKGRVNPSFYIPSFPPLLKTLF